MGRYDTDEITGENEPVLDSTEGEEQPSEEAPAEGTPAEEGEGSESEVEGGGKAPEEGQEAEPAEDTYAVRIDGQEVELPVSELTKGYLRQADYTRKTQALAQRSAAVQEAELLLQHLDQDPARTLAILAHHYKVDLEGIDPDEIKEPSPEQTRIQELETWQQTEVRRQREAAVDAEVARLHRDYGAFDDDELYAFAVEHGVGHLETALRAMAFDRNGTTPRVDKRKVAAQAGGSGHSATVRPKTPVTKIESFQDAYAAAKAELMNGS